MTGNNGVVLVNQDRIRESEGLDAAGNLTHLVFRMGSCVSGICLQIPDWLHHNEQLRTSNLHNNPFILQWAEHFSPWLRSRTIRRWLFPSV